MNDGCHSQDKSVVKRHRKRKNNPVNTSHRLARHTQRQQGCKEDTIERSCYGLTFVLTTGADVNNCGTLCAQQEEHLLVMLETRFTFEET